MRPENNPLDLNNLPQEYTRDGKQVPQESPSPVCRKKKSSVKDAKDECGKVYECRFCSLKFCKSQALGGHMNRHRQERETETLNHARQLVYRNDHTLTPQSVPALGCCQAIASAGWYGSSSSSNTGEATMRVRFPKYMCGGSSSGAQGSQHFLYASARPLCFPSARDYYVGHVVSSIGAPVGGGGKDRSVLVQNEEGEGLSWGKSCSGTQQQHSAINRFHDEW